jgi:ferredoxin
MKASVNKDLCTGCGLCVDTCPDVFEMGDDAIAVVRIDTVTPENQETCREAADNCPVEAIDIRE